VDTENLQEFVDLENDRRDLELRLKQIKERRQELEEKLLSQFEESGVQSMRVNGMTVYMHRQLWANHNGDKETTVQALRASGLGDMIYETFNSQTLSAWVREMEDIDTEIPEAVRPHLKLSERFSIRTQR
jgi:hypothetical protein